MIEPVRGRPTPAVGTRRRRCRPPTGKPSHCPEGWRHGNSVIEPILTTVGALNDSAPSSDTPDPYYCLRKLSGGS